MSLPPQLNDITPELGRVIVRDNTYRVLTFSPDEARIVAAELVKAAAEADTKTAEWSA